MKSNLYFLSTCLIIPLVSQAMHNKQNTRQERQLTRAVKNDNTEKIQHTLTTKKSKKLATVTDHGGYSLLHKIASAQAAQLLLAAHANANAQTNNGLTPLHLVQTDTAAQVLINAHADVLARDQHGRTPLHYARSADIATTLLNAGSPEQKIIHARANARDKNERTPLFMAQTAAIVNTLIAHDADVNAQDKGGNTALHCAANPEVAHALIAHKANLKAHNKDGLTPFEVLARDAKHHKEILLTLLKNYALITYDKKAYAQYQPLLKQLIADDFLGACFVGDTKTIEALLEQDPQKITTAIEGLTPLNTALSQHHIALVQMLLIHGARIDKQSIKLAQKNKLQALTWYLKTFRKAVLAPVMPALKNSSPIHTASTSSASTSSASSISSCVRTSLQTSVSTEQTAINYLSAPRRTGVTYAAAVGCRCHH